MLINQGWSQYNLVKSSHLISQTYIRWSIYLLTVVLPSSILKHSPQTVYMDLNISSAVYSMSIIALNVVVNKLHKSKSRKFNVHLPKLPCVSIKN